MDMRYVFAPGCALLCYKPHLATLLKDFAVRQYGPMETLLECCFDRPQLEPGTCIVTPCATCAEKYIRHFPQCTSVFLLTDIARSTDFPFPDYGGQEMSIQDTCTARKYPEYLETIRILLERMDIRLVEPLKSGRQAKCCGQVFYGKQEVEKVAAQMKKRADEMPREDVVTYCASCIMSMTVGGKRPRYITDLLFGEPTDMSGEGPDSWNGKLAAFRKAHRKGD